MYPPAMIFTARCYAERGYAEAAELMPQYVICLSGGSGRLSVSLSVCDVQVP